MIYVIVLITILTVSIFVYNLKLQEEYQLRINDPKLGEYYYESKCHRNDGWAMQHYRNLYKERLKELKNDKNKTK